MSRPLPDSEAYEDEKRKRRNRQLRRLALLLIFVCFVALIVYLLTGGPLPESLSWLEAL